MAKVSVFTRRMIEEVLYCAHPEEVSTRALLEDATKGIYPPKGRMLTKDELKRKLMTTRNTVLKMSTGTTIEITKEDNEAFLEAIEGMSLEDVALIEVLKGDEKPQEDEDILHEATEKAGTYKKTRR